MSSKIMRRRCEMLRVNRTKESERLRLCGRLSPCDKGNHQLMQFKADYATITCSFPIHLRSLLQARAYLTRTLRLAFKTRICRRQPHSKVEEKWLREAVLCAMYSNPRYELSGIDLYLQSTQGAVEKGHSCRMSSLW